MSQGWALWGAGDLLARMQSKRVPPALDLLDKSRNGDIWVIAGVAPAPANRIFSMSALGLGLEEEGTQVEGLFEQVWNLMQGGGGQCKERGDN